jgi:RimJ/RimL family protein N-acetyltransferase
MEIRSGTIDDIVANLGLIQKLIPEKSGLTAQSIAARLANRNYGVQLALECGQIIGINVWYDDAGSLYLWLGAATEQGRGTMSEMLKQLFGTTKYRRAYVKINTANMAAQKCLSRFSFREYRRESNVIYLERCSP